MEADASRLVERLQSSGLEMEVLTHTKRRDFKYCRRYFYLRHEQGLTLRAQKAGRRKGTIFAHALEAVRKAHECEYSLSTEGIIRKEVRDSYSRLIDLGQIRTEDMEDIDAEEVKVRVMALVYTQIYGVGPRREIEFRLPLKNPESGRSSRSFILGGKMDGLKKAGGEEDVLEIVEDKFTSQIQKSMIESLPLDDQASEYVTACMAHGYDANVLYRHTRVPGINPKGPKMYVTKDDYPGETMEEYEARLLLDVNERRDFYFHEERLVFPTDHLGDYVLGRWQVAQDILLARRTGRWYTSPGKCLDYGGCAFLPLCKRRSGAIDLYITVQDNVELDEGVTSENE